MKPISLFDAGSDRVARGGSWYSSMQYARVASRYRWTTSYRRSYLGFRLFEGMR